MNTTRLPLLIAALLAPTAASAADAWQTYINGRFAFSVCYPGNLLLPQGEADNGDGATFKALDGAELRAFGANNALDKSLADEAAEQARAYTGRRGKITYRAAKGDWAVISGNDGGGSLFYTKTFTRGDQFVGFQLKYPKGKATRYAPVVERIAGCFKLRKR
jgi:hypothetical protein